MLNQGSAKGDTGETGIDMQTKGIVMQTGQIYTETVRELVRNNSRRNGRKMERPGNGMEDSKRRRGDRGEQTHAKPPPTAPGDLGSGDRDPPSPLRKRGEHQIVAGASGGRGRGQLKIQLMIQRVQDVRGGECIVQSAA